MPRVGKSMLAIALVVGVVVMLFSPTLAYDFVWDDRNLVLNDFRIRSLSGLLDIFSSDFFRNSDDQLSYGYYRPLISLSLALDMLFWRTWAGGFHLTNLVLHALCSLGVVAMCRKQGTGLLTATGVALLFAVHPIHTESVTWIAGRTDVQCTLLCIAYLLLWDHPRRQVRIVATMALAGALLSKELALVAPVLAWLLAGTRPEAASRRQWKQLLPAAVIIAAYLPIRMFLVPVKPSFGPPDGIWEHLMSPMAGLVGYLGMIGWPGEQSAYLQVVPADSLADPRAALGLAVILLGIWLRLVDGRVGRLALALLVSFVPMANLVRVAAPVDMGFPMSERFVYLPSVLAAVLLAAVVDRLRVNTPARSVPWVTTVLAVATLVLVGGYAQKTWARNPVWKNDLSLFTDTLAKVEDAPLVDWQLASALRRNGREQEAHHLVIRAVRRLRSENLAVPPGMVITLATSVASRGNVSRARAILRRYIKRQDRTSLTAYNIGVLAELDGDREVAIRHFEEAVERRPDNLTAWLALGIATLKNREADQGIAHIRHAITIDPNNLGAWHAYGVGLVEAGRTQEAMDAFEHILSIQPDHLSARLDLAVLTSRTDPGRAREMVQEGLRWHPGNPTLRDVLLRIDQGPGDPSP